MMTTVRLSPHFKALVIKLSWCCTLINSRLSLTDLADSWQLSRNRKSLVPRKCWGAKRMPNRHPLA